MNAITSYKFTVDEIEIFLSSDFSSVTKCGFVSRNILGRRCKPLEARAAGNVAA